MAKPQLNKVAPGDKKRTQYGPDSGALARAKATSAPPPVVPDPAPAPPSAPPMDVAVGPAAESAMGRLRTQPPSINPNAESVMSGFEGSLGQPSPYTPYGPPTPTVPYGPHNPPTPPVPASIGLSIARAGARPKVARQPDSALGAVGSIGKPMIANPMAMGDVTPPNLSPSLSPDVSIGTPIQPTARGASDYAIGPANARLNAQQAQGPPQYHGLKRVGDALLGATTIGSAIERAGHFGSQGYEGDLEAAGKSAKLEDEQQAALDTSAHTQAETGASEATAHHANVSADVAQAGSENVMITLPDGRSVTVPAKDKASVIKSLEGNQSRENIADKQISARDALQNGKPISIDQLASQAIQEGDQETYNKIVSYKTAIAKAGASQPGNYMPVNDPGGNTIGWVNPKAEPGKEYVPVGSIPGLGSAVGAQGSGGQPVIAPKPGQLEQRMDKMADYSIGLSDDLATMVNNAKDQLGPEKGRWNEFVTGRLGLKNVTYTEIKAQMTFLASAMTLAHSQGRVATAIFDQFEGLYNNANQDPDNILAAIEIGRRAMQQVRAIMGGPSGSAPPVAPVAPVSPTTPAKPSASVGKGPMKFDDWVSSQKRP